MEKNCEDCMQWEEQLYWTHFQTLHFSQLLLPGFHNRLVIPQKFSTHCKRKLPKIVTLKSPSGVTYNVGLEEDDEKTLAFCCGWEKFVKDHSLVENDFLVFKFLGISEFEVLIFDGDSFCEKPTCYFVKKCGHAEKKTSKGVEFTATSSRSLKRDISLDDVETTTSNNQQRVMSPPDGDNEREDLIDIDTDTDTDTDMDTSYEQKEQVNSDIDTTSGYIPVKLPTSGRRINEGKYPLNVSKKSHKAGSSKTSTNEISKRKALSLAKKALSPNGLLVIMQRSHVVTKYFLTIPMKWCAKNMSHEQEVVMQVDQKKWQLMFKFYGARNYGGISTGWKKFAQDNNLCMGDVCVFEPTNSETEPLHLDVHIFRAGTSSRSLKRDINTDDVETTTLNQQPVISQDGNELEDLIDTDNDLVVSQAGSDQEEHVNSDIGTASGHIPVILPTGTRRISEGKYPLNVFKKMRGEISQNYIDRKAEMISSGSKKSASESYKRKALSLAKRAISPNGFLVIMKSSHVVSKYLLNVPSRWCGKNKCLEPREVVMQVDQTKWQLRFNFYRSRGCGGIATGWKKFVQDNNLCVGDVCVFEPVKSETKSLHLNVSIFRAAEAGSSNNVDSVYTISE